MRVIVLYGLSSEGELAVARHFCAVMQRKGTPVDMVGLRHDIANEVAIDAYDAVVFVVSDWARHIDPVFEECIRHYRRWLQNAPLAVVGVTDCGCHAVGVRNQRERLVGYLGFQQLSTDMVRVVRYDAGQSDERQRFRWFPRRWSPVKEVTSVSDSWQADESRESETEQCLQEAFVDEFVRRVGSHQRRMAKLRRRGGCKIAF
ncbi:NADPH-dependent FMN reductase family protein [Crateriforma conspicua]|uniref:hypothetical protein n=1 Tax=Crateriforma conspicua TaxID=2527996 RepID=UPI00118CA27C|nr:hypothetical protein [Crateriforma conspicua]QDV61161.1 hypothetical protein Mal65_02840 [Crateriforma conspicua]